MLPALGGIRPSLWRGTRKMRTSTSTGGGSGLNEHPKPALAAAPVGHLDPADILTPQQLAQRLQVSKSWVFEQTRGRAKVRNKNPLH